MIGRLVVFAVFLALAPTFAVAAETYHKTPETVEYRCLFNHELLIVCHNKNMSPQSIGAFVEKLEDTDVDAVICVETKQDCADLQIDVSLNGTQLESCEHDGVELFPPLTQNESYATSERLKFYTVPLDSLVRGENRIHIKNADRENHSVNLFSVELGLYR